MKLITYRDSGKEIPAFVAPDNTAVSFEKAGVDCRDVLSYIKSGQRVDASALSGGIPLEKLTLAAPIPRPDHDIICLGINYAAHAEESARYKKEAFERDREYPVYFSKRVIEASATGDKISLYPDITEKVDYEAELAVVIGKTVRNVRKEDAYGCVFGYTVLNDVSARDIQTRHKQWYFGKSLDGFTAMGPCIVTADELDASKGLPIRSFVNGELRQNSNTSLLMFDIPHIIEELSAGMTLTAGTVISTGTPSGVGMGFVPPRFLRSGDTVACTVDGIGTIINTFF